MFILILCIIGIIVPLIVNNHCQGSWVPIMFILSLICGFLIGIILLNVSIKINAEIVVFQSVEQSVTIARVNGESFENAALQLKIVEMNKWLANIQYYNRLFFLGDFIPNAVDDLEPIQ